MNLTTPKEKFKCYIQQQLYLTLGLLIDHKMTENEDLTTTVSDKLLADEIVVYPNLATSYIRIGALEAIKSVELYSADGNLARKLIGETNSLVINIEGLNPGMYFLRVQTNDQIFTQKMIKK